MSKEMKVIMESWDKFILQEEDLPDCNASPVDVETYLSSIELLMLSPEMRKEKIKQLKSQKENIETANRIIEIATIVGGVIDVASLGATAGAGTGSAALGGAVIAVFANVINAKQQKKTSDSIMKLLKILCIDEALLDTVDNEIEKQYWSNSDLRDKIEQYISRARATANPDPMPDFTSHFVQWLNQNPASPYAKQGTGGLDTDIVVRGS
jgi:hypothetical protein